jgi:hypothetical protein
VLTRVLLIGELDFVADGKYDRGRSDHVMREWRYVDPDSYVRSCRAAFEDQT